VVGGRSPSTKHQTPITFFVVVAGFILSLGGCSTTEQDRIHAYSQDGVYLFQHGDFERARQSFETALLLKPEDPSLLYNIGQCYDRQGNTIQAERYYTTCLMRDRDHVACHHALAVLLVRGNRRPEAERMVGDWLSRSPKLAAAYAEDGWLLSQAGDLPRAQARLQQALELDPHDTRALTELGRVYEAMRRPDRALVLYERSLESDRNQPDVTDRVQFLLANGVRRPRPD
jgi:Flp pilus assembly protein TadD